MTCLRYPDTDPYYPGHVIHLRGDEDPHEARALATDLIDLVEHHYQAKDGTLPLHRSGTLPTVCGTCPTGRHESTPQTSGPRHSPPGGPSHE